MKVTISFVLPEEKYEAKCAMHGSELLGIIDDVDDELRSILKYNPDRFNHPVEALEHIRTFLHQAFEYRGLSKDYFEG